MVTGGSAFGTVGQAFTYPINATNSPTSYNATGLPAILSVNTVTGLISGTPAAAGASSVALSATNAGGTGTATLSLTISPPPCGTTICGHVNAAELPANTLQKMVVELRDASGALRKSALTDSTGQYTFNNPPAGSNYVSVATGRNQVASPSQSKPLAVGSAQDFPLRGVAAEIHVTDTPSTFVLITPGAGPLSPPTISQPSGTPPQAYSGTVGLDGKLTLKVPYGANGLYHMTCWKPVTCGTKTVYLRAPAAPGDAPINAGNPVTPGQSPPDISCADTTAPCP